MHLIIEGSAKEIAALVLGTQGRQMDKEKRCDRAS